MGTWGTGLYENDTALDVQIQFEKLLSCGWTAQEIMAELIADFASDLEAPAEAVSFWYALADTQWQWGMLLPEVKTQALCLIEAELTVFPPLRRNVLLALRSQLLSPQPPMRIPRKKRVYKCQWDIGDVFAVPLESDLARTFGLLGRYFLIQKIDEDLWHPGHTVPIVYVKLTDANGLPKTSAEFDKLPFVQTGFSKYEERFWPINGRCPEADVARKSKLHYQLDAYGYLPQFRIRLLNTSAKVIPSSLIYLGNFSETTPPEYEFIPHAKVNISAVAWVNGPDTFETKILSFYIGHNLRQLPIYRRKYN